MKINHRKETVLSLLISLIALNLFSQTFVEQTGISLPAVSNGSVAWGDYNNDGNLDILVAGFGTDNSMIVKVYRNNGNNTFSDLGDIFSPLIPGVIGFINCSASWADFDNDGYLDILITGPTSTGLNTLMIYRNEGNSTFTLKTTFLFLTLGVSSIDPGDYDNDGDIDILLTTSKASKIYQNLGNFVFSEQYSAQLSGLSESSSRWSDYDNDGDLDILLTGFIDDNIYNRSYSIIYQNQGNNSFVRQTGISLRGVSGGSGEWGDYNGDGFPDLFLTGSNISNIYKNNGDNTFTEQSETIIKGIRDGCGKWGDFDNDGDLDIIITGDYNNGSYITMIYLNNGNNTFTEQTAEILDGVYQSSVDLGDYDNDGDLDILISGNKGTSRICKIYRNESPVSNPAPVAPTDLITAVQGSDMILRWRPVSNDNTTGKSISYNIMVGTSTGNIDVVSPNSSVAGFRRISGIGNGQLDTTFILRNIKKGNYFWSVQAVDNSFKGGAFSAESTINYSASYQAYGLNVPYNGGKESTLSWSRGNGANCIVFMKEGKTGAALPENNTTYIASVLYKSGSQISNSGWYCIYNGNQNTVRVTGLTAFTDYIFQVIEFDGNAGAEQYNIQTSSNNPFPFKSGYFTELGNVVLQPVTSSNFSISQGSYSFWTDIDNDNDLDLLLVGPIATCLYRNDGNDSFTLLPVTLCEGMTAAVGDYDNDGFNDIIINNDSGTKVYKNNGNYTFTEQTGISLSGGRYGSLAWGDYNNDGYLDLVITGANNSLDPGSKIFRNNGNNSFSEQPLISLTGVQGGSSSKWGDYDNDGFLDLLISGSPSDSRYITKIYRNNGNNNFIEQTGIILPGVSSSSADWGDYDNDGYLDLLISGFTFGTGKKITKIYRNNRNNNFIEQTGIILPGVWGGSVKWGDYDNDGDLDILLSGWQDDYYPISKIYKNNGNNTFEEDLACTFIGVGYSSAAWGDYDNDGDLDIVLTGNSSTEPVSKIYRNDIALANIKPAAPTDLVSSVYKSDVTLKWKSVRTDNTSYKAMSYNVKVGTMSGGINGVSPHSLTNGYRSLVGMGNGNLDTTFFLKNLPFGTYYWSVQAIDNGFTGGAFSVEDTFSVIPVQAKNLSAKILNNNSLSLKWERGNGDRCIVFCKQTSSEFASPVNNISYVGDSEYGYGGQIGSTGWYCVYNGRSDSVIVKGLTYKKDFSFHIIEYIGTFANEQYFTEITDGNPGVFSTSMFSEQTGIPLAAALNNSVVWGDYDNDGFLDILHPGSPSRIYHNNGNNTFSDLGDISLPGIVEGTAAWGDYDNDGDLDILITGATGNNYPVSDPVTKIYKNDGSNIFTEQTQISLADVYYSSVAWGDYDNDGNIDILLTGATGSDPDFNPVSKIYRNNGDGTFTEQTQIPLPGVFRGSVAWADYDNDGDLDILITGAIDYLYRFIPESHSLAKIFRNNGNNSFTEQSQIHFPSAYYDTSVAWGDFDNDGDLDLLTTSSGPFLLHKNLGDNTFETQWFITYAYQDGYCAVWGDYNNDGYLDILYTNAGISSNIYKNINGKDFIEQNEESLINAGFGFVSWCDYDNDGDLDILFSKGGEPSKIYRNNSIMKSGLFKPNMAPAIPVGIKTEYSPSGIFLKWSPVRNDETPWKSMSYNVKIGTRKDSANICPPHSLSTGYRKIVSMGNAQMDTTFLLKNLASGNYYWSVQAVDQGLKGGAWSAVDSFEVKNVQTFYSADTVCLGFSTHFTDQSVAADGVASWKWDFKDGTTSTDQNPVHTYSAGGTYNVKLVITSNGGVKDSLEQNIIIKSRAITGFSAIPTCQGLPISIINTTDNNGLNIISWYWEFGDGQISATQQPPAHGYLIAGNYQVKLKAVAYNGCADSITKTVTLASYPVAVVTASTPITFCSGESVILSSGYNNMYSYQWLMNGTPITNADSSRFVTKITGNYSVEVTNTIGNCKTTSDSAAVSALDAPSAPFIVNSGSNEICQGDSLLLSVTNTPGYSFRWRLNGGAVGLNSNQFYAKNAGTYTVDVSNSSSCSVTSSNSVTLKVNPLPSASTISLTGSTEFCQGENVVLSVPNNSALSYQWQNNGSNISSATSNAYTAQNSGIYSLNILNSDGCSSKTENVTVNVLTIPSAPSISAGGSLQFCQGDSVILSVTPTPGYSYQWKLNGGAVGLNSSQFVAKNAGTFAISVSNSSGCSANSTNTINVIVNPKPTLPTISINGPTLFCQGGSVELSITNNPSYTYQWENNGVSISGALTNTFVAQNAGVYLLKISNSNGCFTKTENVTVNTLTAPSAPFIIANGSLEFCQGDSLLLSVTNIPGYSFRWRLNDGAVGLNSNQFYAKNAGTYTVDVSNSTGCSVTSSNSITLKVNPLPSASTISLTGSTEFCQGDSLTMSVPLVTGYSYQWFNAYGPIAGKTLNSFSATTSGQYSLRVTNDKGCQVNSHPLNVMVKNIPAAPKIVAENYEPGKCNLESPITLSVDQPLSNYIYRWKRNGTYVNQSGLSYLQDYLAAGDYSVEVDKDGCRNESKVQNISFENAPKKPDVYVRGPVVWYMAASNDSASGYNWYLNNEIIPGAVKFIYVANKTLGTYKVAIRNEFGCIIFSDEIKIPVSKSGMTDFIVPDEFLIKDADLFAGLKIYPNPTPGLFTIEMDNNIFGDLNISILTQAGKEILKIKFQKNTEHFLTQVDLSGQPNGLYIINLLIEKYFASRKLVVE